MMPEARLPSWLWVDALIRRVQVQGSSCFVLQKGDHDRGDVLIKVSDLSGGARAYVPRTDMDGERIFSDVRLQGVGELESDVDAYVQRARSRDSDLWVLEIEDREGRHFLTEDVESPEE
ncbi:DUF1491 family protein [Henriciella litoralis]|uniref:DUF1491 family protein n=1 Tax=Henriciella litoralis TaxID=568102 RepID=UPI001F33CDD5|nr:DUF1491 family protein [Henriciella litoralis]